jgi:hypothetical protein
MASRRVSSLLALEEPYQRRPVLYVFIVMSHERRQVLHFNVTESPSACWAGQQIIEAFPYDTAPKYLLCDRDSIYGKDCSVPADSF